MYPLGESYACVKSAAKNNVKTEEIMIAMQYLKEEDASARQWMPSTSCQGQDQALYTEQQGYGNKRKYNLAIVSKTRTNRNGSAASRDAVIKGTRSNHYRINYGPTTWWTAYSITIHKPPTPLMKG